MDGTTKASEYCMFGTCNDVKLLSNITPKNKKPQKEVATYDLESKDDEGSARKSVSKYVPPDPDDTYVGIVKHINRLKRRGFFDQPWILFPLNIGNFHGCLLDC
jgi:hypothetical protein